MKPEIEAVLRLQRLDLQTSQLKKEIEQLPKHIAEIEKKLDSHTRRLEADRTALGANQKERKKLEDDIKVHEQKISKLRDQMLQAKTNDQYRAFQNEIKYCEDEIRKAEDRILDFMSESEPLDKNVKAAEASLTAERKEVDAEKAMARQRTAEDEAALARVAAERSEVVSSVDPQVLALYERIRKRWSGAAVVEGTSGRCAACNMAFRPQFFQDLKRGDKLLTCESCGRIIFYNPPVNLEHELHQKV